MNHLLQVTRTEVRFYPAQKSQLGKGTFDAKPQQQASVSEANPELFLQHYTCCILHELYLLCVSRYVSHQLSVELRTSELFKFCLLLHDDKKVNLHSIRA